MKIFETEDNNINHFLVEEKIATDLRTGLIWKRYPLGSVDAHGEFVTSLYNWDDAVSFVRSQECGWRLPNLLELLTLVERVDGKYETVKINSAVFPMTKIHSDGEKIETIRYWTNTPCDGGDRCLCRNPHNQSGHCCCAFVVGFWSGNFLADNKNHHYAVRLVRGSLDFDYVNSNRL